MSNHNKALVPIETWAYSSPEIRFSGKAIDIGLFAEALIYYDQILLNITTENQFSEFLMWFIRQNEYSNLLALFNDDTIKLYDYSFRTSAIKDERVGAYIIMNMQDPTQEKPNTFEQRFLYHPSVVGCFDSPRKKSKLYKALRGKVIEKKAGEFSASIENARLDYLDPRRKALLIQSLVDEVYPLLNLGKPPEITVSVESSSNINKTIYNVDFEKLKSLLGPNLNFHLGAPLTGIAHCNRLIWSAAQEKCDLYLGNPMANLVGDKLYESQLRNTKIKENINRLNYEVDFPDIRPLA